MDYTQHLLPSNASPLEQALSRAMDTQARLVLPTEAIRSFKTDPADSLLPWLIWEYGLGELLPWLPEPHRAIKEGILWQRLRGTPEALRIALSWIGAENVLVEEEVPGVHFSEFQIDPGFVPVGDALINDLIAIAQLSAPTRSRLARIYHGYDLRRFILDESFLGEALLSDNSGVLHSDGRTKLSFGRVRKFAHPPSINTPVIALREAAYCAWIRYSDRYLLDFSRLGDSGHTRNDEIIHSRLFSLDNELGLPSFVPLLPERKFCRAGIVLSDSTPLGDTNANLPRFYWQESGTQIRPGFTALSESDHRLNQTEVLERLEGHHPSELFVLPATSRGMRAAVHVQNAHLPHFTRLGQWKLGENTPIRDVIEHGRLYSLITEPLPQPAGFVPRLFQKAQVVLSQVRLGDINARTPRRALLHRLPASPLGQLILGEHAGVEWQPLTDVQICTTVLTTPTPYSTSVVQPQRSSTRSKTVQASRIGCAIGHLHLGQCWPEAVAVSPFLGRRQHNGTAAWKGQTWTQVRWPDVSWNNVRELVAGTHHSIEV